MKTTGKYILKGKKVIPCYDLLKWARWLEIAGKRRIVKQEDLSNKLHVSTVFLGLDQNFFGKGKRILFETMVFKPLKKGARFRESLDQDRCSTYKEAEEMHKKMVEKWKKE